MDVSLIELIDKEIGEPPKHRPDGFGVTVKEYALAKTCNDETARKMLDEAVELGLLEKQRMVDGPGSSPYVYYKKQSPPAANEG